ncbi:porimin isoform X2 [Octopus bimaculoides]|uniref:Sialomucin core protein 24 n=1 Tax=Octopus bimaculoides TaxID=37653 RepID=A0A0L8GMD9_OCTBM|nr:porimin isoform X2 [Octopus bimaculoides]|eukprot:XP_014779703.1 PREDICTED: porimin-like isoform X2 [Octopus bimaculoides]
MLKMTSTTRNLYTTIVTGRYVGIIFVLLLATSFIVGVNGADNNSTPATPATTVAPTEVSSNETTTIITTTNSAPTTPHETTTVSPSSSSANTSAANGSSTAVPVTSTTHPTSPASSTKQHFDAASFIGGIILCAGVIAIVFFGCKFYKARTSSTVARY